MEKISSGAYVLHTQSHTALLTSTRLILVDTAMEESAETLLAEIKKCGYQPKDIETIIITHSHIDHIGGLATAKSHMESARVACHKIEVDSITQQVEATFDDLLVDGQVYQGLLVIHTPGHTIGGICLYDGETLISGDTVFADGGFGRFDIGGDINALKTSIQRLADLNVEYLLPGHGPAVDNGSDHIKLSNRIIKQF